MIKLIKILFVACTFSLIASTSYAEEEIWACDGWTATGDGSKTEPFILRGNYEKYYWKWYYGSVEGDVVIKKIGEDRTSFFDIYVSVNKGSTHKAYYIEKDNHFDGWEGNDFHKYSKSLKLVQFHLSMDKFITNCYRQ